MDLQQLQLQIQQASLEILQSEMRKTCFHKCYPQARNYSDELTKADKLCLSKCQDRMLESHNIVQKAATEMSQNLQASQDY